MKKKNVLLMVILLSVFMSVVRVYGIDVYITVLITERDKLAEEKKLIMKNIIAGVNGDVGSLVSNEGVPEDLVPFSNVFKGGEYANENLYFISYKDEEEKEYTYAFSFDQNEKGSEQFVGEQGINFPNNWKGIVRNITEETSQVDGRKYIMITFYIVVNDIQNVDFTQVYTNDNCTIEN